MKLCYYTSRFVYLSVSFSFIYLFIWNTESHCGALAGLKFTKVFSPLLGLMSHAPRGPHTVCPGAILDSWFALISSYGCCLVGSHCALDGSYSSWHPLLLLTCLFICFETGSLGIQWAPKPPAPAVLCPDYWITRVHHQNLPGPVVSNLPASESLHSAEKGWHAPCEPDTDLVFISYLRRVHIFGFRSMIQP